MSKNLLALILFSFYALAAEAKPKLRWGADVESGAPYSYKSPDDNEKVIGFEAEIASLIADDLGMELEFVQNSWDGLVEGLIRGDYDVVINGVEITEARAQVVHFSQPYYYTSEALSVRKSNQDITSLHDLKGRRVGTLDASLAQKILNQQTFPITTIGYDEEVHCYGDLALGRIDAVLLDEPIALYYAKPNVDLKIVGGPIGYLEYGVVTRFGNPGFDEKIKNILDKRIQDGSIRKILERWNLWNGMTAKAWGQDLKPQTKPVAYDRFIETNRAKLTFSQRIKNYVSFLPLLAKGAVMTLELSVLSMILAIVLGLATALSRLYGPAPLRWMAVSYVEVFRGTPLLIQLYLIFYGLPHVGINFDPFVAAVLGLGLNYGACEAENYRAGILSIPKSQMDASQALGMNWYQSLRHIILPQAIRVVIPPVTNDFIALLKDSSLVSVISMVELTTIYGQLASTHFDYLGLGILTACVYFLVGLPFVRLSRYFENQLTTARPRPTAPTPPPPQHHNKKE